MLLPAIKAGQGANNEEHAMSRTVQAAVAVIGIDIGKSSLYLVGQDNRVSCCVRGSISKPRNKIWIREERQNSNSQWRLNRVLAG
jgi:hypothetical protein